MSTIIDGKLVAKSIKDKLKEEIKELKENCREEITLALIIVGDNFASQSYVRSKQKACEECGIKSIVHTLPNDIKTYDLLSLIDNLNKDDSVNGIIVQLPLPKHIDTDLVINEISPKKDVDGFTTENMGKLLIGKDGIVPATPLGIIKMLEYYNIEIEGKNVTVIGRSNIVGKPIAQLMLQKNGNVTMLHSKTKKEDMKRYTLNSDIIIVSVGIPNFLTADMVSSNTTIIDVGINRIPWDNEKGYKVVGDVDFDNVKEKCDYITPVPGGVGLTTVASLLMNTANTVL